jgi:hypothetical protein
MIWRLSPTFMVLNASSHPRMTCPAPTLKVKGRLRSRELSNLRPWPSNVEPVEPPGVVRLDRLAGSWNGPVALPGDLVPEPGLCRYIVSVCVRRVFLRQRRSRERRRAPDDSRRGCRHRARSAAKEGAPITAVAAAASPSSNVERQGPGRSHENGQQECYLFHGKGEM